MSQQEARQRIATLLQQYQEIKVPATEAQSRLLSQLGDTGEERDRNGARHQISRLLGERPVTEAQARWVARFPPHQVTEVLRKEVVPSEVTRREFSHLLKVLAGKGFRPRVYNHPLESYPSYEYGWQESPLCSANQMYYIVFYDLLMVDIDSTELDQEQLEERLRHWRLSGRLYRTHKGYHLFITSTPFPYRDPRSRRLMLELDCDPYYVAFSTVNGYKVRLSPKLGRENEVLAAPVAKLGNIPEDPELLQLLRRHDDLLGITPW